MLRRAERILLRSYCCASGAALLIVGGGKLWSVLVSPSMRMALSDPVLPFLTKGETLSLAALLELAVAGVLLSVRSTVVRLAALLWLAAVLMVYRLARGYIGGEVGGCSCLGAVQTALGLGPLVSDVVSRWLLIFLFVGSTTGLICCRIRLAKRCYGEDSQEEMIRLTGQPRKCE